MAGHVTEARTGNRLSSGTLAAALGVLLCITASSDATKVQKQVVMFHHYPVRVDVDLEARTAIVSPPDNIPGIGKSRTFYDYNTVKERRKTHFNEDLAQFQHERVIAYKDFRARQCHLERMSPEEKLPGSEEETVNAEDQKEEPQEGSEEREAERRLHRQMGLLGPSQRNRSRQKRAPQPKGTPPSQRRRPKTMYVTETILSKYEVLRLAGRRISHFCRGFPATLLVQRPPSPPPPQLQSPSMVPWLSENELPGEGGSENEDQRLLLEAALVKARLAELEMQTLDSSEEDDQSRGRATKTAKGSRMKRQAAGDGASRSMRPRRFRGQTQSQFVSFGGGDGKADGTAQAESRPDGTSTVVRENDITNANPNHK